LEVTLAAVMVAEAEEEEAVLEVTLAVVLAAVVVEEKAAVEEK